MGQNQAPATTKHLQSVAIAPHAAAIALGNNLQFSATALFSDGSKTDVTGTATWISAQPKVASINSAGMAISKTVGATSISAVYQSVNAWSNLTVAPAALVSIAVTPQTPSLTPNHSVQLSATGTFSDGTTQNLSSVVTWSSTSTSVLTINASGLATANSPGAATVTASEGSIAGSDALAVALPPLVSIAVTPRTPSLNPNHSVQLSATGTFSDGTTQDLSRVVTWSSTSAGVLTISATGLATANSPGAATVTASEGSIIGSDAFTVALPTLVSIGLSPQSITLTPMHSAQLKAVGTYSDATTQDISASVTWSASPGAIVAVSNSGLATGKALGAATITAVLNTVSGMDTVAVVAPTLNSISIAPNGASIPLGETQQLAALGTYSDGSTQDLTSSVQWASSNLTILTLSNLGAATGAALGTVTVTAISGTISAADLLQVGPPIVVSFTVAPANSVLAVGGREQLSALAQFSDGTTQDMTTSVSWSSADPTIANVSNQGLLLAEQVGDTTISVSSDSVGGSSNVTVKPVLAVSYFSNAHTSGVADATVRLTNPGVTGGNLCAEIYVFDQSQQLSECCGCLISPDGLRTLSVNTDLTGNPLTGAKSTAGVVKIVPSDASANASCDPTAIAPDASLVAWSTNIQKQNASSFAMTETPFQLAPLGDDELAALQNQCSFSSTLGSGQGVCSCGTVADIP
ncbi:MAG: Ig-like domain-containing protein [Candidatus Sulfotelmatobacter sp.]|jgi:hypothetical protein